MKATKLIEEIQKLIDKHGDGIEVFLEVYHSGTYKLTNVSDAVGVDVLSDFPKKIIREYHGEENDTDGPGIIFGVNLYGRELVQEYTG